MVPGNEVVLWLRLAPRSFDGRPSASAHDDVTRCHRNRPPLHPEHAKSTIGRDRILGCSGSNAAMIPTLHQNSAFGFGPVELAAPQGVLGPDGSEDGHGLINPCPIFERPRKRSQQHPDPKTQSGPVAQRPHARPKGCALRTWRLVTALGETRLRARSLPAQPLAKLRETQPFAEMRLKAWAPRN